MHNTIFIALNLIVSTKYVTKNDIFLLHNCGVSRTHFIIVVTDSMQFKKHIENHFNSEFFNKNYANGCRWGDSEGASCVVLNVTFVTPLKIVNAII